MDLSNLSDQDVEAISKGDLSKVSDAGLQHIASGGNPSLGKRALDLAVSVGKKVDSYTGAPVRSAISAYQNDKSPLQAYMDQFGKDTENVPTGKQIAQKAGISDKEIPIEYLPGPLKATYLMGFKPTYSGAAGLAVDVGADPTNLIPGAGVASDLMKGTKAGNFISKLPLTGATKLGHALTGVPERSIETYILKTPEVNEMIAKSGGDMAEAANNVKQGISDSVQSTRKGLNSQISDALKASSNDKVIDVNPVLARMNEIKSRINPALQKESIAQVDDLLSRIGELAPEGKASVQEMQDLKGFLQERGSKAYSNNGQIFQPGTDAQIAAKSGASETKKILDQAGPSAIKEANSKLSELHHLEDVLNPNLLAVDKSNSALRAAGAGLNPENESILRRLGILTGSNPVGEAEKLSSASHFSNPAILPIDTTGKSNLRTGLAAGAGYYLAGPLGAAITGSLTSPAALKLAINAGRIPVDLIKKVTGASELTEPVINAAYTALKTDEGAQVISDYFKKAPNATGLAAENKPGKIEDDRSTAVKRRLSSQ